LIRALGWLKKHRPDLVVCNVLLPIPASGTSVLSTLLREMVEQGVVVLVPALDSVGEIADPGNTAGVITVAPIAASSATAATMRANGHHVLAPRGIQAKEEFFPHLDYPGWTVFSGPAAAAAITAGTAGLMLRVARICRHQASPSEITDHLLRGRNGGILEPDQAVNGYLAHLTGAGSMLLEKTTAPVSARLRPSEGSAARPLFIEEPTAVSEELPGGLLPRFGADSDATQPLDKETVRSLAEIRRRDARGDVLRETFDEAATVQGEIPEHVLNLAMGLGDGVQEDLDEADRPEWWPESEEISIDGLASGNTE
jgi:hypothetical protein